MRIHACNVVDKLCSAVTEVVHSLLTDFLFSTFKERWV